MLCALVRMWRAGNAHSLLVEMQNGTDTLVTSYKTKPTLTISPYEPTTTLWRLPKGTESLITETES